MPSKMHLLTGLLIGLTVSASNAQAAGLLTLFTTPEERQIINANRYKTDEPRPVAVQQPVEEARPELEIQRLMLEEVTQEYRVSGITISRDGGAHTVWINSTIFMDGDRLDDGSRIKVYGGDDVRVRITAPDGKYYYGKSGETVLVSYMAPVEN